MVLQKLNNNVQLLQLLKAPWSISEVYEYEDLCDWDDMPYNFANSVEDRSNIDIRLLIYGWE